MRPALATDLGRLLDSGQAGVAPAAPRHLSDATEVRRLRGTADAVVGPGSTGGVARPVTWCYSIFLLDQHDASARARAETAAEELFAFAAGVGGTVSGEHGVGLPKASQLRRRWTRAATDIHARVKDLFDPKGLLNPGKKVP